MGGHLAEQITADRFGFGNLAYYRTQVGNPFPRLRGVPIWTFKIRLRPIDAILAAVESVDVNHDDAKRSIIAIPGPRTL